MWPDVSLAWPLTLSCGCIWAFSKAFAPCFTCSTDILVAWFFGPLLAGPADLSAYAHLALTALVLLV